MKAIIFDFDGVIHDTFEFHLNKIKQFTGIQFSKEEFSALHNGNFFNSKIKNFKKIDWVKYREFVYDDFIFLKLNEEIRTILLKLKEKYDLYIISSNGKKNISAYLGNNNILFVFKEVFGPEINTSKEEKFKLLFEKYSLLSNDCLFITDTLGDILEANRVNVKTIAVDFGYHQRDLLSKGNPYRIISKFDEIFMYI